ncbi:MAG: FAD-dependent thymidylate synthase [Thermovenabulum sp.]|uniref:FAD-dependent thymidylate synthase n=1 Tax=Thermovenabulum sp. TaxID=3100335 RepID=UPI003C7C256C
MKVKILNHTPDPEKTVAAAARLCYSNSSPFEIMENMSEDKVEKFLQKLISMGHLSPIEHVSFTFGIEGVSRTLLAQLTRHRIASYSVQSLRYNNPFKEEIVNQKAEKEKLQKENLAYIKGITLDPEFRNPGKIKELLGNYVEQKNINVEELNFDNEELIKENISHFIRGISDAFLEIGENFLMLPEKFKEVIEKADLKFEIENKKLLFNGENAINFCQFIYKDLDFSYNLYFREKLFKINDNLKGFFETIISYMEEYIKRKYYSTLPQDIKKDLNAIFTYLEGLKGAKETYLKLVNMGVDKEDARYILPMGTMTNIVMTMNARSLYNFFSLRCCNRAQSEIRELANLMLEEVKKIAPNLFKKAGAPCESLGYCPEGDFSCGRFPSQKNFL